MKSETEFQELCTLARKNAYLKSTKALVEWDQQTYMPKGGGEFRAEQLTFLASEIHRRETDPRIGELLDSLKESDLAGDPHSDSGATIRELDRIYRKKKKLPSELVEAQARAQSLGQQTWIEARKADDFSLFSKQLKEIFQLKREEADAIGGGDCRYDALLDDYEPGAKTSEVELALNGLRDELVPLIESVKGAKQKPDGSILRRNYPIAEQKEIGLKASAAIGFDYDRGRLDIAHHPFCQEVGPTDVRLTTRYDESFFSPAFFGTLHEAGHGIYEQGLRTDQYGVPPGAYCSLGIHESQSRLWENLVGRSRAFWQHFYPLAQSHFPDALKDVSEESFYSAVNEVRPSLIRVEADQATYDLHIIIRFELERALLDESLDTDDLPAAWNQKYQQYLGVQPPSDADGVLQDIHWSAGLVGYFPTYSLGNLYASQFWDAAERELGPLFPMFEKGDFAPLKHWLNQNVHECGNRFPAPQLGERITGNKLSHHALIRQMREKLTPIYQLS